MISRSGNGNFLSAHYDWIAAGVGVAALVGACAFCFLGGSVEEEIDEITGLVRQGVPASATVASVDMTAYALSTNAAWVQKRTGALSEKATAFLSSEKRVICASKSCGRAVPEHMNSDGDRVCPVCNYTQEVAKAAVVLDKDNDGMPDKWELANGLNPNDPNDADADADGDAFTNLEEYQAKTDPRDKKDHPDYLDSLSVVLPLQETHLPFLFLQAMPIPSGWRCVFFNPDGTDDYGRRGETLTAVIGEEIGKSGFVLKGYQKKSVKRAIAGSTNMREVDVSEASIERKRDGKLLTVVVAPNKKAKPMAIDVQATLAYARGTTQNFKVVAGSEIVLSGNKYRIVEIKAVGKGAKVTVENRSTGKKRTLDALEP